MTRNELIAQATQMAEREFASHRREIRHDRLAATIDAGLVDGEVIVFAPGRMRAQITTSSIVIEQSADNGQTWTVASLKPGSEQAARDRALMVKAAKTAAPMGHSMIP